MFGRKTIGLIQLNLKKREVKMSEKVKSYAVHTRDSTPVVMEADLEDAMDIAGAGKYQIIHGALMLATLSSALIEMIGIAFVLPAASCDLNVPDSLKGIITSVPNIGIVLTAPFWGRAADTLGRKPVLLLSCTVAGSIGFLAAFMPGLTSFAICKFAGSLFLSGPSSLGFAYACEMLPRMKRDLAVLICNSLLMTSATFSPLFAWGIVTHDWEYPLGYLTLRPWRVLTMVNAMPLLLTALWMTWALESPKFLMTKGKVTEALEVLKKVYAKNSGLPPDSFRVISLKSSFGSEKSVEEGGSRSVLTSNDANEPALALLRPPHLKWFALIAFLMFGLFSLLNGLFLFAPDAVNKAMVDTSGDTGTICKFINEMENKTNTGACVAEVSNDMFLIMVVTTLVYGVVVIGLSFSPLNKKTLLVSMYVSVAAACLVSGLTTNRMIAGITMSALQMTALGIGPLTAYAVQLFPTSLRGTAVCGIMMFGRLGSAVGANAAGFFLAVACTPTFYGFTFLLLICAALSFLLPKDQASRTVEESDSR